ncbi:phage tail protein I [Paenibacillus albiflavus]|uniref:Phage tail protein I n=1 Tax=Paenibacillus albiflavus TaxID=2545760 RepID=A0A4R4E0V7_9BACL|nr:phage tail protein I [Paenibacillus albiflavus]TCZ73064.1 phage tail protein I [Paenibacillus albiflavus]
MQLDTVDLLQLQTKFMKGDETVQGFSAGLNTQFREIACQVKLAEIYSRIEEQPEEVLDILAWQFNVDWYEAESDIDVKRQAINDALLLSRIRGTPAAVQRVVEIYFGDGRVEEWFEYGGKPSYFRVITNNPEATNDKAALLARAVNSVKNLRSRLETVIIESSENMDMRFGFALHMGDKLKVEQVV